MEAKNQNVRRMTKQDQASSLICHDGTLVTIIFIRWTRVGVVEGGGGGGGAGGDDGAEEDEEDEEEGREG